MSMEVRHWQHYTGGGEDTAACAAALVLCMRRADILMLVASHAPKNHAPIEVTDPEAWQRDIWHGLTAICTRLEAYQWAAVHSTVARQQGPLSFRPDADEESNRQLWPKYEDVLTSRTARHHLGCMEPHLSHAFVYRKNHVTPA